VFYICHLKIEKGGGGWPIFFTNIGGLLQKDGNIQVYIGPIVVNNGNYFIPNLLKKISGNIIKIGFITKK